MTMIKIEEDQVMSKKIISVLLIVLTLMTSVPTTLKAETINTQAQVLNQLNILRGNGVSFNLTSNLSRAEGAAFIVRMLGLENEVLKNSELYPVTTLTDVPSNAWYTPYVGYCVAKGIIVGYADFTFRPNADLNEQAFLKIVLVALGYEYGKDFTWADTFKKAYTSGLVTDSTYLTKVKEETGFTRGGVVDLIYAALKMKHIVTGKTMAYNLSENTSVAVSTLEAMKLVAIDTTQVVKAIVRSKQNVFLAEFSQVPYAFNKDMITIKDQSGESLEILTVRATENSNIFEIYTKPEVRNSIYTFILDKVYDKLGNPYEKYEKTILAYDDGTYTTNLFGLLKATQVSSNSILLSLSQPIEPTTFYGDSFYITVGNNVVFDGNSDNGITGELVDAKTLKLTMKNGIFEKDVIYTVHNRGSLRSDYRTLMVADSIVRFVGSTYTVEEFKPTAYERISDTQIKIYFNRLLNETIGNQIYSYYLEDMAKKPIKIVTAKVYNETTGSYVLLTVDAVVADSDKMTLTLNQIYTPNRDESIIEKTFSIVVTNAKTTAVKISSLTQIKATVLKVEFNQKMDLTSVQSVDNYLLTKTTSAATAKPIAVHYDSEGKYAYIYFADANSLAVGAEYTLTVTDKVKTAGGVAISGALTAKVTAKAITSSEITVDKALYIGDNVILLKLTEPGAINVNSLKLSNYQLYSYDAITAEGTAPTLKKEVLNGVVFYDPTHILLFVADYNSTKNYKIHVDQLTEFSGVKTTMNININVEQAQ